jgi:hypothetical protein
LVMPETSRAVDTFLARSLVWWVLTNPGVGMPTILLVANKTLVAEEVSQFVKARMLADDATRFTLLVPATANTPDRSALVLGAFARDVPRQGAAHREVESHDFEHARHRLDFGLDALRLLGATADGLVGHPNPTKAISEVLERRQFDEVVVFTLPKGISRWLHLDLPHQIKRKFHVPVTVITTA